MIRTKESAAKEPARAAIDRVAETPCPGTALKGDLRGLRRLRAGGWRVLYEVRDEDLIVLVVRVAHRREAGRTPG